MILPFQKPLLKKILDQHTKLINSEVFKMVVQANYDLMEMFDMEKTNCRFYMDDEVCTHKKGNGVCFILVCPRR